MRKSYVEVLSAFGLAFGIAIIAIYVRSIYLFKTEVFPEIFFWLGALIISISLGSLWLLDVKPSYLLLAIFISACAIVSIPFLRFYYYGTDLLGEYFVANTTNSLQRWTIESGPAYPFWYFTCLSVTILPSMIAQITGMPIIMVFRIMIPMASALAAIGAYLLVRKVFNHKIASLSAIIFISSNVYLSMFQELLRQDVALFFLFLTFFLILKAHASARYSLLALITMFALATSHYTVTWFAIFGLCIMAISNWICRVFKSVLSLIKGKVIKLETILSRELFLCSVVIGLSWLAFIAYVIFTSSIGLGMETINALLGLHEPKYSYLGSYALFSSLGFQHTIVNWLIRGLAVFGFFVALRISRDAKSLFFSLWGGINMFALFLWFLLPNIGEGLHLDRVYSITLITFSMFIALSITQFRKKFRNKLRSLGTILPILIIVIMLLESLDYPIYFHAESSLSPNEYITVQYYTSVDFKFAQWVKEHTSRSASFISDVKGRYLVTGFTGSECETPADFGTLGIVSFIENQHADYFVGVTYVEGYFVFYDNQTGAQKGLFISQDVSQLFNSAGLSRVFDNGKDYLLGY
jgi:uncharacterized membrane protein